MILRRVIDHFRKQEWTAIAIDFLIVVIGVFVGIQAANLNDARGEERLGDEYLRAFREDLLADSKMLSAEIELRQKQLSDAKTVLEYFDGRALEVDRFFNAYYSAIYSHRMQPSRNTMDEVLNSGNLRLVRNAKIRNGLLDLYAAYEIIALTENHIARDFDKYLYDTTFTSVPFRLEQEWENNAANQAIAKTLLGNLTVENGFRLTSVNLQFAERGLIADLTAARRRVETLLEQLPSQ